MKQTFQNRSKFLSPPVFPGDDEKTRVAALLHTMLITLTLLILISIISSLIDSNIRIQGVLVKVLLILFAFGLQIPMRMGWVKLTASLLVASITVLVTAFIAINGTIRVSGGAVYLVLTSIMAGLLISRRAGLISAIINSVIMFSLLGAEMNGLLPPPILSVSIAQGINFAIGAVWVIVMLNIATQSSNVALTRARDSEQRYRSLLENIPAITYLIGVGQEPRNPAIYVSPQVEKISGYAIDEFLKDPLFWLNMVDQADRERIMAEGEDADLTGKPFDAEYRVIAKDKRTYWFHDKSVLVKDDSGKPLYRVGVWTDITERKQAELALQRLEDMYRRAIDAAGAVPYILDESMHAFTFIGGGILQMTGYPAFEMNSEIWNSLVQEGIPRGKLAGLTFEQADRLTDEDHSLLWECDFRIRTRDGQTRWIADTSVKGIDETTGRLLAIGIKQDITERKLAEEMREKLIQELEQRNAELERLAYTLSHELKSPLITIRGFLGYLYEDALSGNIKRLEQDFRRITEGSEKMQRLINELIDLMSVGRILHDFKEIPLQELVNEAVEQVREKIQQKNIMVHIAKDLPNVYGDHKRLVEVFQNLLENSIKFMGGQSEPKVEIGYHSGQDDIPIFFVRDNGIGIDMHFNERIFGIFHKLDATSEGTGIGLALVKRIIELHGGRVWVESEGLTKGATFCFTIPDSRKRKI